MEQKFIGVTRFSVVSQGKGAFRIDHLDRATYLDELFSDNRLSDRVEAFVRFSIPSLRHFAKKFDYTHLLQVSPQLPTYWRRRLDRVAEENHFLRIVEVSDESMADSVRQHLLNGDLEHKGPFAWFRLDDDDFLSFDFIDRLAELTTEAHTGWAVSFGKVLTGLYVGQKFTDIRVAKNPFNSQGQAYIGYADTASGVVTGADDHISHHIVTDHLPTLVNNLEPFAFWTRHVGQDTLVNRTNEVSAPRIGATLSNLQAELAKSPSCDSTVIQKKFPQLWSAMSDDARSKPDSISIVHTRNNEWFENPLNSWGLKHENLIRCDFELRFVAAPNSGTTLWLDWTDSELTRGSFPRDEARGDYRRLNVDHFGHGTIVFPANPLILKRMKIANDNGHAPVESATLRFTEL